MSEIGLEFVVFLTLLTLMEACIQEHNLLPGCAFGPFTYVCYENCMTCFSAFLFLTYFV